MKRAWVILIAGLALATGGYFVSYRTTISCCGLPASGSELSWLKDEFHLNDAEFRRVTQLHEQYLPACRERCAKIDAQNAAARALLLQTGEMTPEVQRALAAAAALREQCHNAMLRHFVEVSRAMPPEQGRRYLRWVCDRTLGPSHDSNMTGASSMHEHSGM